MVKQSELANFFQSSLDRLAPDPRPDATTRVPDWPESEQPDFGAFDAADLIELSGRQTDQTIEGLGTSDSLAQASEYPEIEGAIRTVGIEALAFYKSYRLISQTPFPGKWGIFYIDRGIHHLTSKIRGHFPGLSLPGKVALDWLRAHEFFHFKFDVYALMAEGVVGHELWNPLQHVYRKHSIHLVEEALANRDVMTWAKRSRHATGFSSFVESYMSLQPGAYARFAEPEQRLSSELAANLLDLNVSRSARRDDQSNWVAKVPWLGTATSALKRDCCCPEHIIQVPRLHPFWKPAWAIPVIRKVIDGPKVQKFLIGSANQLVERWGDTKSKLVESPALNGLDFKRWSRQPDLWSVRVGDNYRAHLARSADDPGVWIAQDLGSHKAMGHG